MYKQLVTCKNNKIWQLQDIICDKVNLVSVTETQFCGLPICYPFKKIEREPRAGPDEVRSNLLNRIRVIRIFQKQFPAMVQGQTVLWVWPAMKYYSYQSKFNVNVNEVILMYPLVYYNFTMITMIADLQCLNKIIKNFI